ncbi:MAG: S-layer related protein (Precursor) [Planctomycetaceae bacterium]|nr:S-layer related protein (Precursor) [Planctomycetaceae bacterium]
MLGWAQRSVVGLAVFLSVAVLADADERQVLTVEPERAVLSGRLERVQLLATAHSDGGRPIDATQAARWMSLTPNIVTVDQSGLVSPRAEGSGRIQVRYGRQSLEVEVNVIFKGAKAAASFRDHVIPVLTKAGCNQGACHASQFGKGGFKLSVFGFDGEADYAAIARDLSQRRISPIRASDSLLLKKSTMQVTHGGGKRFGLASYPSNALRTWIAEGAVEQDVDPRDVAGLTISPGTRTYQVGQHQQLRVVAHYRNGRARDVTVRVRFDSLDDGVVTVESGGRLAIVGPGQAGVMVRYRGQTGVAHVISPYAESVDLAEFEPVNFIDEQVRNRWQLLGVRPSGICTDAEFMRRAFIDCLGTLPSSKKIEAFLASTDVNKRAALIDEILGLTGDPARDAYTREFGSYWTLKFGDILRNNRKTAGDSGMWALHNWLKQSFRENKPLDRLARELITAQGSIFENGPVNYIAYSPRPTDNARVAPATELGETTAQVFLGVRLLCAKCHHHPFEAYSQADYYGLAAFFTGLQSKTSDAFGELGFDAVVSLKPTGEIRHPRTGDVIPPKPLRDDPVDLEGIEDLREPLADWLLDPNGRRFARAITNRVWGYLMGTGVVDPVDDMRSTNPPSNFELLDALAADLVASKYDLRLLLRNIMNSRVYQLSATPRPENVNQTRFYTHYNAKRLPAEVLLDAINFACGTREKFPDVPRGMRAIELPDPNFESYFLDTLGRPQRLTHCECERTAEPNLTQVLHLANGDHLYRKLTDKSGRIEKLIERSVDDATAVRELYLVTFSRPPEADEVKECRRLIERSANRREGLEDILWALCNGREFLLNH